MIVTRKRPPWGDFLRWGGAAVSIAALLTLPWIVYNEHVYGAPTGIKANANLTRVVIGRTPATLAGVAHLIHIAAVTLFTVQFLTGVAAANAYRVLWAIALLTDISLAVIVSAALRRWHELGRVLWLTVSLLLGVGALIGSGFLAAGGGTGIVGRHLGVLYPMFGVLVAYSAVLVFGTRMGTAVLLSFLLLGAVLEVPSARWAVRTTYAVPGMVGNNSPILDHSLYDKTVTTSGIRIHSPCPVTLVGFAFGTPAPTHVLIGRSAVPVFLTDQEWTVYKVPTPLSNTLDVIFDTKTTLGSAHDTHDTRLSFRDRLDSGAPTARAYYAVARPAESRFHQLYRPEHPFPLTLHLSFIWPIISAVLMALGMLLVSILLLRSQGAATSDFVRTTFTRNRKSD
jgi:hypothetical protein